MLVHALVASRLDNCQLSQSSVSVCSYDTAVGVDMVIIISVLQSLKDDIVISLLCPFTS